jgi:DNA-directed RNA polymerase beta subunit
MQSPKKLRALQYSLETFHRSNQDTSLVHKPTVFEGDWVQPGDLLADCSASEGGELALGHNILVAYMPWEGYNFEDAILISEKLVYDDVFTSIHIERYETETQQTKLGSEKITREVPEVTPDQVKHLDSSGFAKIGSWVEEGDILVGKISPLPEQVQSPSQKFLYKLLDKKFKLVRDSSLRAPKSIKSKVIKIEVFSSSSDSDSYFDSSNYDSDKTHKQTLVSLPTSPTLAKPAKLSKLSKLSKGGKVGKRVIYLRIPKNLILYLFLLYPVINSTPSGLKRNPTL